MSIEGIQADEPRRHSSRWTKNAFNLMSQERIQADEPRTHSRRWPKKAAKLMSQEGNQADEPRRHSSKLLLRLMIRAFWNWFCYMVIRFTCATQRIFSLYPLNSHWVILLEHLVQAAFNTFCLECIEIDIFIRSYSVYFQHKEFCSVSL